MKAMVRFAGSFCVSSGLRMWIVYLMVSACFGLICWWLVGCWRRRQWQSIWSNRYIDSNQSLLRCVCKHRAQTKSAFFFFYYFLPSSFNFFFFFISPLFSELRTKTSFEEMIKNSHNLFLLLNWLIIWDKHKSTEMENEERKKKTTYYSHALVGGSILSDSLCEFMVRKSHIKYS